MDMVSKKTFSKTEWLPSGAFTWPLTIAIEMMSFSLHNGGSFHSATNVYQRAHRQRQSSMASWYPLGNSHSCIKSHLLVGR